MADFFDPKPEAQVIVLLGPEASSTAEVFIASCEQCKPDLAEIPMDWVLDRVTGNTGENTDYLMDVAAKCPACGREVWEKTLVELNLEKC